MVFARKVDRQPIRDNVNVFAMIHEAGGPEQCKVVLDRVERAPKQRLVSICIARCRVDEYLKEADTSVHVDDLFYVIDRNAAPGSWKVKPISHTGKEFLIPREYLEIDPNGLRRLQQRYGQKVYYAQGGSGDGEGSDEGAAPSKSNLSRLAALKMFSAKSAKSLKLAVNKVKGGSAASAD